MDYVGIDLHNKESLISDEVIEAATRPDAQRLRTVSSVGPVTAAPFMATIDDAQRFRRAHEVEVYLGLVPPRELSSGESQRRGITQGRECADAAVARPGGCVILRYRHPHTEALRVWATRIAARRGKKIAVVLVRRLADFFYAMLRDGTGRRGAQSGLRAAGSGAQPNAASPPFDCPGPD